MTLMPHDSPVGWDKSYPLKPMQTSSTSGGSKTISNGSNAPIYRKNSSIGLTSNGGSFIGNNGNKYRDGEKRLALGCVIIVFASSSQKSEFAQPRNQLFDQPRIVATTVPSGGLRAGAGARV